MASGGSGTGLSTTAIVAGVGVAAAAAAGLVFVCSRRGAPIKGVNTGVKLTDMKPDTMREVKLDEKRTILLVYSVDGQIRATGSKCPHVGAPLVKGVLSGTRVTCPWHGACFNTCDGDIEDGPVLDKLPVYPTTIASDGFIWVDVPGDASTVLPKGVLPALATPLASDTRHFVVVGGGAASASAVESLRHEGFTGKITLISREGSPPYDRPKLSKSMAVELGSILLRTEAFYRDTVKVNLMLNTTVTGVRTEAKELDIVSGTATGTVKYDKLLLATGGAPRRYVAPESFVMEGASLRNIFPLRDAEHAVGVEAAVAAARAAAGVAEDVPLTAPIVIVGSSFIGMEAAAYLKQSRKCTNITVVGMESVPFERVLGKEVGAYMQTLFAQQGIQFKLGAGAAVARFGADASGGAVGSVVLKSGEALPAAIVLIGAGIIPATGFLASATGVEVLKAAPGGVRVNEFMKTGADGVFCAGDIAYFPYMRGAHDAASPLYTRIEHWDVAYDQGRLAAKNMLAEATGKPLARYDVVPFFWTTSFGKSLRYTGHVHAFDRVVIHGNGVDPKDTAGFTAFYVAGDRIAAVATVGATRDVQVMAAKELFTLDAMPPASVLDTGAAVDLQAILHTATMRGAVGTSVGTAAGAASRA